jgi:hypothetical protein
MKHHRTEIKLPKRDILLEVLSHVLGRPPRSRNEKNKCKAAYRVMAWLGLGTIDKAENVDFKLGYLLQLYGSDWTKGGIVFPKREASQFDRDVIESVLDAGLGEEADDIELRESVTNVLAPLRLICYAGARPEIPTKILRKLAVWRRREDRWTRSLRLCKDRTLVEFFMMRKEAGLRVDPETAEICREWRESFDPYDVLGSVPPECQSVGSEWFARAPSTNEWVLFEHLPPATRAMLMAKDIKKTIIKARTRKEALMCDEP